MKETQKQTKSNKVFACFVSLWSILQKRCTSD